MQWQCWTQQRYTPVTNCRERTYFAAIFERGEIHKKNYIKKRNRKLNQMVLSIPTFCTANMGHMETSVQSTVNHCNQDYSYSAVFLKLDCCSKCSEITVNLKYSGLLYHLHFCIVLCMANSFHSSGTVNHCNSVLQFLHVSSL